MKPLAISRCRSQPKMWWIKTAFVYVKPYSSGVITDDDYTDLLTREKTCTDYRSFETFYSS